MSKTAFTLIEIAKSLLEGGTVRVEVFCAGVGWFEIDDVWEFGRNAICVISLSGREDQSMYIGENMITAVRQTMRGDINAPI